MAIKPEILKGWGPGGWQFYQPETDWHAPGPLENNFAQQVVNIIAMRKQNPRFNLPTDEPTVAAELEAYTEARWAKTYSRRGMDKFRLESQEDKKKESSFTPPSNKLRSAIAGLAGIDTRSFDEWLGAGGKPVAPELALNRAEVCAKCDANKKSGWLELLTVPAAMKTKLYLEKKHQLNLETYLDNKLGSCQCCHCVLELKVWQPLWFITEYTTPETFEKHRKANEACWTLTEQGL